MDTKKSLIEAEDKREFERSLKYKYGGATVKVKGRLVMEKGKILDKTWWKNIVDTAWERRKKYSGIV